jgi:hypothetical protein
MATQAQLRANRANAQRSTGPKSVEGKQRSAQNSRTHGLTARRHRTCVDVVLQSEDPLAFEELHAAYRAQFQPVTPAEHALVDQLTAADWRLRRAWRIETALVDLTMDHQAPTVARQFPGGADDATRTALACDWLYTERTTLDSLQYADTYLGRAYLRALRQLLTLRATRTGV